MFFEVAENPGHGDPVKRGFLTDKIVAVRRGESAAFLSVSTALQEDVSDLFACLMFLVGVEHFVQVAVLAQASFQKTAQQNRACIRKFQKNVTGNPIAGAVAFGRNAASGISVAVQGEYTQQGVDDVSRAPYPVEILLALFRDRGAIARSIGQIIDIVYRFTLPNDDLTTLKGVKRASHL